MSEEYTYDDFYSLVKDSMTEKNKIFPGMSLEENIKHMAQALYDADGTLKIHIVKPYFDKVKDKDMKDLIRIGVQFSRFMQWLGHVENPKEISKVMKGKINDWFLKFYTNPESRKPEVQELVEHLKEWTGFPMSIVKYRSDVNKQHPLHWHKFDNAYYDKKYHDVYERSLKPIQPIKKKDFKEHFNEVVSYLEKSLNKLHKKHENTNLGKSIKQDDKTSDALNKYNDNRNILNLAKFYRNENKLMGSFFGLDRDPKNEGRPELNGFFKHMAIHKLLNHKRPTNDILRKVMINDISDYPEDFALDEVKEESAPVTLLEFDKWFKESTKDLDLSKEALDNAEKVAWNKFELYSNDEHGRSIRKKSKKDKEYAQKVSHDVLSPMTLKQMAIIEESKLLEKQGKGRYNETIKKAIKSLKDPYFHTYSEKVHLKDNEDIDREWVKRNFLAPMNPSVLTSMLRNPNSSLGSIASQIHEGGVDHYFSRDKGRASEKKKSDNARVWNELHSQYMKSLGKIKGTYLAELDKDIDDARGRLIDYTKKKTTPNFKAYTQAYNKLVDKTKNIPQPLVRCFHKLTNIEDMSGESRFNEAFRMPYPEKIRATGIKDYKRLLLEEPNYNATKWEEFKQKPSPPVPEKPGVTYKNHTNPLDKTKRNVIDIMKRSPSSRENDDERNLTVRRNNTVNISIWTNDPRNRTDIIIHQKPSKNETSTEKTEKAPFIGPQPEPFIHKFGTFASGIYNKLFARKPTALLDVGNPVVDKPLRQKAVVEYQFPRSPYIPPPKEKAMPLTAGPFIGPRQQTLREKAWEITQYTFNKLFTRTEKPSALFDLGNPVVDKPLRPKAIVEYQFPRSPYIPPPKEKAMPLTAGPFIGPMNKPFKDRVWDITKGVYNWMFPPKKPKYEAKWMKQRQMSLEEYKFPRSSIIPPKNSETAVADTNQPVIKPEPKRQMSLEEYKFPTTTIKSTAVKQLAPSVSGPPPVKNVQGTGLLTHQNNPVPSISIEPRGGISTPRPDIDEAIAGNVDHNPDIVKHTIEIFGDGTPPKVTSSDDKKKDDKKKKVKKIGIGQRINNFVNFVDRATNVASRAVDVYDRAYKSFYGDGTGGDKQEYPDNDEEVPTNNVKPNWVSPTLQRQGGRVAFESAKLVKTDGTVVKKHHKKNRKIRKVKK
ncbi:hypothetical protein TVAG_105530 [Trichomonas vaginalis G3]|uniref:Uncharacterized protein n=1 Tax=Trichomonas vaginalis (strain ATCC PRA-98 / G3) TaxID=412133 RepID=A2G3W3_TRIV3|nr:hypothetical protein TVAGG3_0117060 [Trichomonas vaginalis G3]EAX88152.1 hypothetical protein TVAG_105530 [Trichomonas vaginalis G3]KAI5545243.1 hypothetical protein TVAGG3_0117060 [Trichomonas vaginalis G3]|eukprot:XP_001301082.1 hypothetical protein [Trichomonas vaginalis G3]